MTGPISPKPKPLDRSERNHFLLQKRNTVVGEYKSITSKQYDGSPEVVRTLCRILWRSPWACGRAGDGQWPRMRAHGGAAAAPACVVVVVVWNQQSERSRRCIGMLMEMHGDHSWRSLKIRTHPRWRRRTVPPRSLSLRCAARRAAPHTSRAEGRLRSLPGTPKTGRL